MDEQIQCVYTVDYLASKRNGTLIYTTGINLESLMLSKRSQIQRVIFKWKIQKRQTQRQKEHWCSPGARGGKYEEGLLNGYWLFPFGVMKKFWELDSGGCTTLWMCLMPLDCPCWNGWRDFPGCPVAKNPCSQYLGPGFDPWSGNQIPHVTTKNQHS